MSETKLKQVVLQGLPTNHRESATRFLNEFRELALQGYVLHPKPAMQRQVPRFMGRPSCIMVTKEYAKEIMEAVDKEVVYTKVEVTPEPEVKPKVEVQPEVETEVETNDEQPAIADEVKAIEAKADLLAFAKDKGLTVPQDKKVPKAIQKWLIQELTK